jgi:hypothetical protein
MIFKKQGPESTQESTSAELAKGVECPSLDRLGKT